jgi:hypothetical protein
VPAIVERKKGALMAERRKKKGKLTAADLASYGITPKQPDKPKRVKGQEPETLDKAAAVSEPMP